MLSASPAKRNGTNDRPSSISMRAATTAPCPMPPWLSGVWMPKKPDALALSCSALRFSAVSPRSLRRSRSSTCGSSGTISLRTKVRTQSRISRSSALRSKSIVGPFVVRSGVVCRVAQRARARRPGSAGGIPPQLGLGEGVLVHFVRAVGETERPDAGEGGGELGVLAEAGGAVGLDGLVEDPLDGLGGRDLDRLDLGVRALVAHGVHEPGGLEHEQAQLLDAHAGLGDPVADDALLGDGPPEGDALGGAAAHGLDGDLGEADRAHAVVDPAGAEAGLGDGEAGPLLADEIARGHADVGEAQLG